MAKYFGVDISEHNGKVNWKKVSKNVDFAVIRIGWNGNNSFKLDKRFEENYKAAKAAGVKLGAYVYNYAKSTNAAEAGAKWVAKQIKGKDFDLPIYFDMEDPTLQGYSKTALTAITKAFCSTLKKEGYEVGVYASKYWFTAKLDAAWIKRNYHTWIAHYTSGTEKYKGEYEMWQNSSSGHVSGVVGRVDTNYLYEDIFKKKPSKGGKGSKYEKNKTKPVVPGDPSFVLPKYKVAHTYEMTTDLKVRKGPGTNYDVLKYSDLTLDGRKHAVKGSIAVLSRGTKVTCRETKNKNDSEVWMKIPSGWVCAYYKGRKYIN